MPFGVTFVGRPFSEPTLIRAAYSFEQAARARRAPEFEGINTDTVPGI